MTRRGALCVIEGGDRSGKSTQAQLLVDALNRQGSPSQLLKFPDRTTPTGKIINDYLKSTTSLDDRAIHLLFSANRWEAFMKSLLESGVNLVIDRYSYSGIAYSAAKGLDIEWCKNPDCGLLTPDIVFYLNVEPERAANRANYGEERYENLELQKRVRNIFFSLMDDSWTVINAERDIAQIHQDMKKMLDAHLPDIIHSPLRETLWME